MLKKSVKTPKNYNSFVKQTSFLYWSTIYEDEADGTKYTETSKIAEAIQRLPSKNITPMLLNENIQRLDTISNMFYGTSYLWWALYIANPQIEDPFALIQKGQNLNVPDKDALFAILKRSY